MNTTDQTTTLRIKYDLCDLCTMPRQDRHHNPSYKMARSPYDIPSHKFVEVVR